MDATLIWSILSALGLAISTMAGYILRLIMKERDEHKAESERRGQLIITYAMSDQTEDDAREFRRQAMEIFGGSASYPPQPKAQGFGMGGKR